MRVVLCRDRALTLGCVWQDATGNALTLSTDLAPGVWHWGLRSVAGGDAGVETSVVRRLYVGSRRGEAYTWGGDYDANGDGFADRLRFIDPVRFVGPSAGSVWLGGSSGLVATGTLQEELIGGITAWHDPVMSYAGDVDGDGYGDAVVVVSDTTELLLLRGSASGPLPARAFSLPMASPAWRARAFVLGGLDMDGDGFDDVIAAGWHTPLVWFRGARGGLAPAGILRSTFDDNDACVALGDLNGDGFDEVACNYRDPSAEATPTILYPGSPRGPDVEHAFEFPGGRWGLPTATGDLDGDGLADHIRITWNENENFYLGDGRLLTTTRPAPYTWSDCAFADVDGDGFTDAIVPGFAPGFARGGPSGLAAPTYPVEAGCGFEDWNVMANAGDTNGDGREDVRVGTHRVEFGASTGLAAGAVTVRIGVPGASAVLPLGDVNGDGRGDMGVPDATGVTVICGGAREVTVGAHLTLDGAAGSGPLRVLAVGDVDRDRRDDVVLLRAGLPWRLYRSHGGSIDTVGVVIAGSVGEAPSTAFVVGDLNGDGYADLGSFRDLQSRVWFGGASGLGAVTMLPFEASSVGAVVRLEPVGDFTGDGRPDVFGVGTVAVGDRYDFAELYRGTPTGWQRPSTSVVLYGPRGEPPVYAVGDLTGDRVDDVMECDPFYCRLHSTDAERMSVESLHRLSTPPVRAMGDLDGDGRAEIECDGVLHLRPDRSGWWNWGVCPSPAVPVRDVNGDGRDDVALGDRVQFVGVRAPGIAPVEFPRDTFP
ncbi:MAG: VCBS repeat-containing protein [Polyangiales bacterium]